MSRPVAVPRRTSYSAIAILVVGLLAFVVRLSLTSTVSSSEGYSCTSTDLAAIVAGVVCLGLAWACVRGSGYTNRRRPVELGAAALGVVFAVVHVLRGVDVLHVATACS